MVICSTPDCGMPGRPFPACSVCKHRAYCGTRCLVVIREDKLLSADGPEGEETLQIKRGDSVCPPCYERWFRVVPEPESEEDDEDYVEGGDDDQNEGEGKSLGG